MAARGRPAAVRRALTAVAVFAALVAGSALAGVIAGFIWTVVAPHVLVIATGGGPPDVVNVETSAFIAADGWFVALCVAGGAASGLLGWALAVRRHGALAVLGLLGGGVVAARVAWWIGQRSGRAAFTHRLAVSRPGTLLPAPLSLGSHAAVAFWPLAAGLVIGGIETAGLLRDRRAGTVAQPVPAREAAGPAVPGQAVPGPADGQ